MLLIHTGIILDGLQLYCLDSIDRYDESFITDPCVLMDNFDFSFSWTIL